MKQPRLRSMLAASVLVAALAAAGCGGSSSSSSSTPAASTTTTSTGAKSNARAVPIPNATVLHTGQLCSASKERFYVAKGFRCVNGRLHRIAATRKSGASGGSTHSGSSGGVAVGGSTSGSGGAPITGH